MYFSRNDFNPAAISEAQEHLQQFPSVTAISSSAYFRREEEEENEQGAPGMGGMEGLLADGGRQTIQLRLYPPLAQ